MYHLRTKVLVCYIAYEPLGIGHLKNFIKGYKKFYSGYNHELLICFKKFKNEDIIKKWSKEIKVKFTKYVDKETKNDFDIGSYYRIAKKYNNRHILFLNSYTRPNVKNWLKIFMRHYEKKSVIGAFGSYSSLSSLFLNFHWSNYSKFQQFRWGIKYLFKFKLFPNPHIRTSGFLIYGKDFLNIKLNINKMIYKIENNYFESGRNGFSSQLIKKGFKLKIVNSNNISFEIKDWVKSNTYVLGNQNNLIFVDHRSDFYSKASESDKKKIRYSNWGIY